MTWAKPRAVTALTTIVIAAGLAHAWVLRWVSDDAFISFRYADNLTRGDGLVWNVGERVEGYTNFLWTLLLAPFAAMHVDLVIVSELLGLVSFAALLVVMVPLSIAKRDDAISLPIATWVLALMADAEVWATGGLETMTFALFAAASVLALFEGTRSARRELAGGFLLAAMVLTRPEGQLLAAIAIAWFVATRGNAGKHLGSVIARVAAPVVVCGAAHVAFRRAYYGDWLPNTYYAKSAGLPFWSQGLDYLETLCFRDYIVPAIVFVACALAAWRVARKRDEPRDVTALVLASMAIAYAIYVTRSGGDFMFLRRLVPSLVLGLAACGRVIDRLSLRARALVAVPAIAAALAPFPLFEKWADENHRFHGVADERSFYPDDVVALHRAQGELLARAFHDVPARFIMNGGLCMLAYYSRLPFIMEPNGLTDGKVAHQALADRALVGHEKHPSDEYLRAQHVSFMITRWPQKQPTSFDQVLLGGGLVVLQTRIYEEATMRALAQTKLARFEPIENVLPQLEESLGGDDCTSARARLRDMGHYYFQWNPASAPKRDAAAAIVESRCASEPSR